MKKLLLVSVLGSLIISSSAFASEGKKDFTFTSTSTTSNTTDLSFAFDDIDSLNIVAMSNEDMEKTQGARNPHYIAGKTIQGGAAGGLGYFAYISVNDEEFSFKGLGKAVLSGAVGGAVEAVTGNTYAGAAAFGAVSGLLSK